MRILNFLAENHGSFRDEFSIELARKSFDTSMPRDGQTWDDVCLPVAAIFGPNASGKSALLDAFKYMFFAIKSSAADWLENQLIPRYPFRLAENYGEVPSLYSLDFVVPSTLKRAGEEVRFHYEFSVSERGFEHELLLGYFSARPTRLLDRDLENGVLTWSNLLGKRIDVSNRELVLSRGFASRHPDLYPFVHQIISGIDLFEIGDDERNQRLNRITNGIAEGRISLPALAVFASIADTGITNIVLDEQEAPPGLAEFFRKLEEQFNGSASQSPSNEEGERKLIARTLRFSHHNNEKVRFLMEQESSGTLAWLAIAVPLVEALRDGTVLLVDELDTSLHPLLAQTIVSLFQDRTINTRGAQLIFTSHDTTLLQSNSLALLSREQVWFTEKDSEGASTLFSLKDFKDIKSDSNVAKRYLEGRLGGTPYLAPSLIHSVMEGLTSGSSGKGEDGS